MFCPLGLNKRRQPLQWIKTCPSTLILALSQGLLLGQIRGNMKSMYPKLALYSSKSESAQTDTVFILISQVCTRGVTLTFLWCLFSLGKITDEMFIFLTCRKLMYFYVSVLGLKQAGPFSNYGFKHTSGCMSLPGKSTFF